MKKTSVRLVPALLLLLGVSTAAIAAPIRAPEVATRTVRIADLDLTTAAGVQTLYGRIKEAARIVCRHELFRLEHECRARAIENAVKDVGSPLLASIHRTATGRTEEVAAR
jgi:UrcA family protein